jgi:uncharacterized membrane protein YgaE (UPF0421/DUF939 family)
MPISRTALINVYFIFYNEEISQHNYRRKKIAIQTNSNHSFKWVKVRVAAVKTLIIFIYSKTQMKPHVQVLCRAVNIVVSV